MERKIVKSKYFIFAAYVGALIGVLAGILTIIEMLIIKALISPSREEGIFILACILAPITEEVLKPIGLISFRRHANHMHLKDWAVLGSFIGVGFAALENAIYFMSALLTGGKALAIATAIFRTFTTLPMHALTSTISSLGFGLWFSLRKPLAIPVFYVISIVIHSTFNLSLIHI